ncbi:DUF1328 domain-containing protein [Fluoribacter dumoffii]|uniref:UPF0391 membrane protein NCTC11370_00685 n=1 Tax=Fluoribacter dumoffii TaxID=463 RepID=A0A377G743_9GAMM|nr:DUF1328 domain-containing protein [Fluoribacter dumoffii]KTC89517.1 hypothetical protein Ldum_0585 [Fluoribacter dumoffii NY 23]MCW8384708.1 DUF1328 domain-containing protein [Fluoribacter dumoffii]MCW8417772.1 DUF1328 domain-containing protein [Fluoribacter dumoffii]MCW8454386.1 DUF1328 domain-containing protein [Fluoribacter dumoffii]MCW8461540.1 DUF1328 domain-containing protein [Fluoribacter dumoffii]
MLTLAFIFLVIAIVSGYMHFKGMNPSSAFSAKILFYISSAIFLILLLIYLFSPAPPVAKEFKNPLLSEQLRKGHSV